MAQQNATADTDAPDVAHRIADLVNGEVIGYSDDRDIFGIKFDGSGVGNVATDVALKSGYVVKRTGSHPESDRQVQFQNIDEK